MTFSPLDSELLGGLCGSAEMASLFSDRHRLRSMLRVETGLARAQAAFGLAPPELAETLDRLDPKDFDLAALGAGTALSGAPAIPFVKALQRKLPGKLEPFLHRGATTQDIQDSAQSLIIGEALTLIAGDLVAVLNGLAKLAEEHRATPCVGRSYGQQAAPISFGFRVAIWLAGIAETAARLPQIREACRVVSYGGPVGTLASLGERGPAVLAAFAAELGLRAPPIAWHTRRGAIIALGSWLAEIIGALAKLAIDVVALSATEVGEVSEPFVPGRGGSSAMPHKRNPVSATVIISASQASAALAGGLFASMGAAQERPAGAWHAEWHALPQLFGLAAGALKETRLLAEGMVLDTPRMLKNLELTRGLIYAEAAASLLAPMIGRSAAHSLVEEAVADVRDGDATLFEAILRHADCPDDLTSAALAGAFDPTPAVDAAAGWVPAAIALAREAIVLLSPASQPE